MDRKLVFGFSVLILLASALFCGFQRGGMVILTNSGIPAIVVEATCSGHAAGGSLNTQTVPCSSSMTVTAGDTIACKGFVSGFSIFALWFNDTTNGIYDNVHGGINPSSTTNWVAAATFQNSASGSITPQINANSPGSMGLDCVALKNVPASNVLDGGSVNQFATGTTGTSITSGSTASPSNANEIVLCSLDLSTAKTTTAGAGFTPSGTLSPVTQSYSQYAQYQIQNAITAQNCPYTIATTTNWTDLQFAILNTGTTGGYRGFTGLFGFPSAAQTNGATASLTILNTQGSGSLWSTNGNPTATGWSQGSGSATTFDTSINPTGTGKIFVQQAGHSFGDAGTSINIPGANTTASYLWTDQMVNTGQPMYGNYFTRAASAGVTNTTVCDTVQISTSVTEVDLLLQMKYDTVNHLQWFIESDSGTGSSVTHTGFSLDTDYWIQLHSAGVSERFHQILAYTKSGGTWSLADTLNYDVLCGTLAQNGCSTPTGVGSGTGSASSGSTSLTITSATGTPAVGNVVLPTTGIPYLTAVEAISGTCSSSCTVTLSQNTNAPVSGTINFIAKPTTLVAATNGTASAGSTALTVVVPISGTIAINDPVGSTDGSIQQGTYVAAVSGTSVTLSQPTTSSVATGVTFWGPSTTGNKMQLGKWSSCTFSNAVWYSGIMFDEFGEWGAFAPN